MVCLSDFTQYGLDRASGGEQEQYLKIKADKKGCLMCNDRTFGFYPGDNEKLWGNFEQKED